MAKHDGKILTVNPALWWLHLLATQGCEIEDEYVPLRDDIWDMKPSTALSGPGFLDVTAASMSRFDKDPHPSLLVLGRQNRANGAIDITTEASLSISITPCGRFVN